MQSFSFVGIIMMLMAGGGSGDLLSYLPTEAYWQRQGVEQMHLEALTHDLRPEKNEQTPDIALLIDQLGSPDYQDRQAAAQKILTHGPAVRPQLQKATQSQDAEIAAAAQRLLGELKTEGVAKEVRRLMAIRALGEKKDVAALDYLKPLRESEEPFVAEYAKRAIAQIQGQAYTPPTLSEEQLQHDLMALPAGVKAVFQQRMTVGEPMTIDELLKDSPMAGMMMMEPEQMRERVIDQLIEAVHTVGNVRLDSVTLGVVGDPERDGYVVSLMRGTYSPRAWGAVMTSNGMDEETVAGHKTYGETDVRIVPLSDSRLMFIGGERDDELPIAQAIADAESGKGGLAENSEMMQRIRNLDRKDKTAWGVMEVFADMKDVPVLGSFEFVAATARVAGKNEKQQTLINVHGEAKDAETAAAAVEQLKALTQVGIMEIEGQMERMPQMKPMMEPYLTMMKNLEVSSEGKQATLKTALPGNPAQMMVSPMLGFVTMRPAMHHGPADVQVEEAVEVAP